MERLKSAGDLIPRERDLDDLPDPLPLQQGQEAPSIALHRLRSDAR
jgi:hypothetical protein